MTLADVCSDFVGFVEDKEREVKSPDVPIAWITDQLKKLRADILRYSEPPWDYPPDEIKALLAACDATHRAYEAKEQAPGVRNLPVFLLNRLMRLAEAIREAYDTFPPELWEEVWRRRGDTVAPGMVALVRINYESVEQVARVLVAAELALLAQ